MTQLVTGGKMRRCCPQRYLLLDWPVLLAGWRLMLLDVDDPSANAPAEAAENDNVGQDDHAAAAAATTSVVVAAE
jgi:hypothetical protein